jgi:hypothetical protein
MQVVLSTNTFKNRYRSNPLSGLSVVHTGDNTYVATHNVMLNPPFLISITDPSVIQNPQQYELYLHISSYNYSNIEVFHWKNTAMYANETYYLWSCDKGEQILELIPKALSHNEAFVLQFILREKNISFVFAEYIIKMLVQNEKTFRKKFRHTYGGMTLNTIISPEDIPPFQIILEPTIHEIYNFTLNENLHIKQELQIYKQLFENLQNEAICLQQELLMYKQLLEKVFIYFSDKSNINVDKLKEEVNLYIQ